jgi:hypothetical protein
MKKIFIILALLLLLPLATAIDITVENTNQNQVFITEINNPLTYKLNIKNNEKTDNFFFYNLLGFDMEPKEKFEIKQGASKEIDLILYPREDLNQKGFYTLNYFIRGDDLTEEKKQLTFEIIDLNKAFEVGTIEFNPESNSLNVYLQNKVDFEFKDLNVNFNSAFFKLEEKFTLGPKQKKEFTVELDKEEFKKLIAGFYTLEAEIQYKEEKTKVEGIIKFSEKNIVEETKKDYGLIVNTKIIKRINQGNTIVNSETLIKKNIFSRLFTSFSPEPDITERQGAVISYHWNRQIKPGETLEIIVKTNWMFPFLVIFFIIVIVVVAKQYSKTDLIVKKRVSFVNTKGGEFALKVSLLLKSKKYLERVNVIDRLPSLVKVYEKFGAEKPTRIDEKTKRIEWNFEKLEEGETRVLSYIIYSKVGVIGKFALPSATAIFEKNGEIKETESNRAFFVSEPKGEDVEEDY